MAGMISIGLTGGIAGGKSEVSRMLGERGAQVIDADRQGHLAYIPDSAGFRAVVEAFGQNVVGADGQIDRRVLGGIVFSQPDGLKKLTDIVWPLTRALLERIKREEPPTTNVLVFEAAVLIEAQWTDLGDEVWVVTVPVAVARERLMARNGISAEQADARIASQITNEERIPHAKILIDNSGDLKSLEERVDEAWTSLLARTS